MWASAIVLESGRSHPVQSSDASSDASSQGPRGAQLTRWAAVQTPRRRLSLASCSVRESGALSCRGPVGLGPRSVLDGATGRRLVLQRCQFEWPAVAPVRSDDLDTSTRTYE